MTRAEFDRAMPREFWREVVDRVAAEVPGDAPPGRGVLAPRGLLRAHPRDAPRLQQRLHEHAPRRAQRRLPARDPEHARVRPGDPGPVRQLHEQPRRADRDRPVRDRRQVLRGRRAPGDAARAADVRSRPGRGVHREVRDGVPPGRSSTSRSTTGCSPTTSGRSSPSSIAGRASPERTASGCTTSSSDDGTVNEDVFAYSNVGPARRALARRLPQPLRRDPRDDPRVGRLQRSRPGRRAADPPRDAGRRPRAERTRGPLAPAAGRDDRPGGPALVGRARPRRAAGRAGRVSKSWCSSTSRSSPTSPDGRSRRWLPSSATAGSRRSTRRSPASRCARSTTSPPPSRRARRP